MHTFAVSGRDVTRAWIAACNALDRNDNPARTGYHTVVRIADPTSDDLAFRAELDRLLEGKELQAVQTVANTLFPAALAAQCTSHTELTTRYGSLYPRMKQFPKNHKGTYFGRLVAYPGAKGSTVDQLAMVIDRLKQQCDTKSPMTAAYEIDVAHPSDGDAGPPLEALVHAAGRDTFFRGFPCLSHCSFQLDRSGTVHAAAYYRSHYMFERAYGNYLGLGRLLDHIASQAGLARGTLTVMAGYAQLDGPISKLRPLLADIPPLAA
ncbi:hypothetical protein [Streptomyces sp. CA-132043]|uniref:hypothetical protein n=1 Tax=Streptomyces sp. CA-132043 TaxID=3240048 RepID=UPI003D8E518A